MKYLIRYCSVLLCLVLLFTASSLVVSAEETESINNYKVFGSVGTPDFNNGIFIEFNPFDNNVEKLEASDFLTVAANSNRSFSYNFDIHSNSIPIIKKGGAVELTFIDVYYSIGIKDTVGGTFGYDNTPTRIRLLATFVDGGQKYYDCTFTTYNKYLTITSKFTPTKDIKELEYIIEDTIGTGNRAKAFSFYVGEFGSSSAPFRLTIAQDKEEMGLLRNISNFIVGIFNSIAELPQKIWSFIENGLKSLFVPSDDYITNFKNDMETMLSEKLGAVYQVLDISLNSWDRITDSASTGVVNIPSVSIPLPSNQSFTFGGYDVKIVPDNFEILANAVKLITGILATLFFVNGLRKKYDEVMGVEQ